MNFDARADAFLAALPAFGAALNAQNEENNALNVSNNAAANITQQAFAAGLASAASNAQLAQAARDAAWAGLGAADQSINLAQLAYAISGAFDLAALAHRRVNDVLALQTQTGTAVITQSASAEHVRAYATVAVTLPRAYRTNDYQVVVAVESAVPAQGHEGCVFVQSRALNGFVLAMTGSATSVNLRWKVLHPAAM
ncbi:MAG: hypothetical protein KGZ67_04680 [Hydrogenophaga sp.]|nr:hypothetical protein [Hydrogenophaga sp.]